MDKVSTLIHSLFHLYIYYHLLKIKVEGIFWKPLKVNSTYYN